MSALSCLVSIYDRHVSAYHGWVQHGRKPPFSKLSGVDYCRLSDWRRGKCGARLVSFEAVANTLGYRVVLQNIKTGEIVGDD